MKTKFKGILTLLLAFIVQISFAQEKTVTGTVSESSGVLPGVSVAVKGTSKGTETDFDGKYSIKASAGDVLVFRYLGYKVTEKTVGTSNVINVKMTEDNNVLDEIVVTGVATGTSTKKLGFSLAKVDTESLQQVPATDAANALRGKVAGVRIVAPSGNPATAASIRLRGSTSISGTQSPLIIVDGIITSGNLKDIPVEDIESMEVIKGAAASSLYGSLAGNGVIQIITKKGKGKLTVDVKSEYGWSEIQRAYPLANFHPYINDPQGVRMGDWDSDPTTPDTSNFGFDLSTGNRTLDPDGLFDNPYLSTNYDNVNNIFTNQPISTQTISLSGSDDKYRYFISAQRFEQGGVLEPVPSFLRNTYRANFEVDATDKLTAKVNAALTVSSAPNIGEQGQGANVFYSALLAEPFINLEETDANGEFLTAPSGYLVQGSNWQNPLYTQQQQVNQTDRQRLLLGFDLSYKIDENWSASFTQSLDQTASEGFFYTPAGYVTPTPNAQLNDGNIQRSETIINTTVTGIQANYTKDFGDLNLTASLKYLFENRQFRSISAGGFVFFTRQDVTTIQNTPEANRNQSSFKTKEIARNYFANVELDYKDKLILNLLGRRDESSLFGADNRSRYFGRGALAYRLTEDVDIKGIQELKFRAAYGTAGQRPPAFDAQYEVFNVTANGISPQQNGNSKLLPSISKELEVGLNMNFLDKYSLEVNYSKTNTEDAHIQVPLSGTLGFFNQWRNVGEIESNYFEVSLSGNLINKDDFSWDFNLNFDTGNQRITELNGVPAFTRGGLGAIDIFRVEEGLPYGTMYGAVLATSVNDLSTDAAGNVLNGSQGGTIADYSINRYGHVVHTASIGTADEDPLFLYDTATNGNLVQSIGNTNPDFNVGFSTNLKYKNFGLYVLADWSQGGDIYNYTRQLLYFNERHQDLVDFASNGTHYNYAQQLYNRSDPANHFVEDGTFVKIREISLDYTLDGSKVSNLFDSVRFSITGRNLFTFTNYTGFDPEVAINTNPTNFKLDEFAYPNFRTYTMAVQIKF